MTAAFPKPLETLDDLTLARLCAEHRPEALRHVITGNNQRLFRAAWSILKDRGEAEEAVQSAYLKAFGGIGRFEGRSTLSTWLTRIAINEALAMLRAKRRRHRAIEEQGIAMLDGYRESLMRGSDPLAPDASLAQAQLRQILERAVAQLANEFRCVLVLRDIEGMSIEQTAECLGLPAATVKTRLSRARRKLRDMLAPDVQAAIQGAFPFAGADCEILTAKVMEHFQYIANQAK